MGYWSVLFFTILLQGKTETIYHRVYLILEFKMIMHGIQSKIKK